MLMVGQALAVVEMTQPQLDQVSSIRIIVVSEKKTKMMEDGGTLMPNMIEGRKKSQFMNLSSMEHSGIANSYYPGYEEDREDMLRECSELMKSEMLYHSNSKSSKHSG